MMDSQFRLMLLRHGNTFHADEVPYQIGKNTDLPITLQGVSQANSFALHLHHYQLSPYAICYGNLQRQVQTANILHNHFPEAILLSEQEALNEIDYGLWEGLTLETIRTQWPQEYQYWHEEAKWPQEIFKNDLTYHLDLLEQWFSYVEKIVPQDQLIICISSQGILRFMLYFIPELWFSLVSTKKMNTYKVNTGHFCDLIVSNRLPVIQTWNGHPLRG